jgi:glycolate oxidase iron-sulfur subunit
LLLFAVARRWRVRLLGMFGRHARSKAPRIVVTASRPQLTRRADGPSLLLGCFERVMYPGVARAAGAGCHRFGVPGRPRLLWCAARAQRRPGRWPRNGPQAGQVADRPDRDHLGRLRRAPAAVLEWDRIHEISAWLLATSDLSLLRRVTVDGRLVRVALQDSCHLRNGLGGASPPREILRTIADYVELPSAGSCCGAAGTYSCCVLATRGGCSRPSCQIEAADLDYVVAVNRAACARCKPSCAGPNPRCGPFTSSS